MTKSDLEAIFNTFISILQENESAITPSLLTELQQAVTRLSSLSQDSQIQTIIKNVQALINIETQLLQNHTTANIIEILQIIKNRPLIMELLAVAM